MLVSTHHSPPFSASICFHQSTLFSFYIQSSIFSTCIIPIGMASRHQRSIETHNYGITFVTSQRGMELPVLDGYVFRCKDKRQRFSCRTKSCRAMLTLNRDEKSVYTVDTPIHTHPPHDTIISTLKRRNVMGEAAKKRGQHRDDTFHRYGGPRN